MISFEKYRRRKSRLRNLPETLLISIQFDPRLSVSDSKSWLPLAHKNPLRYILKPV